MSHLRAIHTATREERVAAVVAAITHDPEARQQAAEAVVDAIDRMAAAADEIQRLRSLLKEQGR